MAKRNSKQKKIEDYHLHARILTMSGLARQNGHLRVTTGSLFCANPGRSKQYLSRSARTGLPLTVSFRPRYERTLVFVGAGEKREYHLYRGLTNARRDFAGESELL